MEVKELAGVRGCSECFVINSDDCMKEGVLCIKITTSKDHGFSRRIFLCKEHARELWRRLGMATHDWIMAEGEDK